jgi:hypothetical protein
MTVQTHVESLTAKHAEIEDIIAREEHRPNPDTIRLMNLKRQKLRLKEEMAKFTARH